MKRILLLFATTIMLATASLVSADASVPQKIRIAAFNFYPTLFQAKDGSVQGFYVDFLNEIAKRENWTIEYVYGNWADGLSRIKSSEVDVLTNVALTAERTQFMDYGKVPLLTVWAELYAPNGSPIDSIRDVQNKKIALMKGDFNAANFKNLIEKFSIPCTYVEYGNFEEVFKAISARQVDAGIVNNTFGTAKQAEYNLKSTGVIFNPFDIFFTVAKGKNSAILAKLDHYLEEWRKNESSPYHQARERWSHKSASTIRVVDPWLKKAAVVSGILLCVAVGFVILLRIQVRRKTAEIQKYTDELQAANRQLEEEIEEHRRAEDELLESKSKFQAFYELGLVGLTITSPGKGWLNINDCLCTILGYSEAELREMTWAQLTHPDDLAVDVEQFECVLKGEIDGYELDKRFLTRSGEIVFAKLVVRCVRKPDRTVDFIVAMVQDITKSKQIENELRDAEWKFRALFNNGPIGVAYHQMIYDESGTPVNYLFIDANDNYIKLTGVDPRGKTATQAFPGIEKDPANWIRVFGRVAKTGKPIHFEQYLQSNDRWYDVVGYQYKPDHFVASFVEITDRKRAEETLHESEFRWKFALEGAGDGVWDWNIQAGEAYYSQRYKEMLGYSEDEIGNTSDEWLKRIHPDDVTGVMTALKPYIEGKTGTASVEYRMLCKDGSWKSILGRGMVVSCDSDGKPLRMIGTNTDLTERKTVEQERRTLELQMQQTQKLESLGVLAGGIAHDFNNILMAIIGNADLALMRINKESPAVENLHRIEQAAVRAADLAKQMLAYSGKGKFVIENIDLNILLEEMLHMLEVSISKKAVLRLNPYSPLPTVEADATQMRQIVMNLVINASEAIGDKSGVIAITTGCMDCDRNYLNDVWLDENISEGLYVYLEIADTGCGMDKATMAKLFDPFFTTKFTGRGLGMAAVLGIVRGHKGAIKVYSEPKRGTTFKILLPASNRPIEIFNGASRHDDWKGKGTVLLVDDEETVRGIGSEMLKELGFSVIKADDGREGVEAFRNNPDISFVILDLTMPHMDGEQCFRELRHIKSDVKVIMSSGYNEQEVTQKFVGKGLAGFIQKPYKLSVLRETIHKI